MWNERQFIKPTLPKVSVLVALLVPLALPWGYVFRHYVRAPGDRWRARRAAGDAG